MTRNEPLLLVKYYIIRVYFSFYCLSRKRRIPEVFVIGRHSLFSLFSHSIIVYTEERNTSNSHVNSFFSCVFGPTLPDSTLTLQTFTCKYFKLTLPFPTSRSFPKRRKEEKGRRSKGKKKLIKEKEEE